MTNRRGRGKRRRRINYKMLYIRLGILILVILTLVMGISSCVSDRRRNVVVDASQPDIDVQLLDVNAYSRPGMETETITGIVIHYTANPGSTAQENRDYFNSLQYSHATEASSNFIVGLDGEIIQCVPTWEVAYASNERNTDTVSIECCHPDDSGKFTDETYRSLVQLTAWLCVKFGLTEEDVIRHYDVTGKNCPKYFVEHEDAWDEFRQNVGQAIERSMEE
ncbi:MAG TPA: peptidoglycan recognition protein family protein [Candidatus Mediterraneibacter stercoravium]|uniref:N-acetylmuramoyl-L-alanine amidase n=1 Tax=Candidatus Mediterraneibacter stercoravium TaxID=2838685 RepID=A0A9D2G9X8_9FIRM|nr:peptidoglycan recognition protein family protein [Candidatus Mediterraneibacter stercoravium]